MNKSIEEERFELASERIIALKDEKTEKKYEKYIFNIVSIIEKSIEVYKKIPAETDELFSLDELKEYEVFFYDELRGENYNFSYANYTFCEGEFGKEGKYLCYIYSTIRDIIMSAYEGDIRYMVILMELFLQTYGIIVNEDDKVTSLKQAIYYFNHDYSEFFTKKSIHNLLVSKNNKYVNIIKNMDLSTPEYLYMFGLPVTDTEIRIHEYIKGLKPEVVKKIATAYTKGYEDGFKAAGIDLSKKETVNIRYPLGFEIIVREAIEQFDRIGLKPVIYANGNKNMFGVTTTPPSRQYIYDHRFDDALYNNHALLEEKLKLFRSAFEEKKEEASVFSGPAVIESFGEKLFTPKKDANAPKYSPELEKKILDFKQRRMLIQGEYIKEDERSFTIIAFPIPEIGEKFEEIFAETIELNTLDTEKYKKIHQCLIDALDKGERVHVVGSGNNKTDIYVSLHKLENPDKQTNFENCLADVNIPVGEVFTSPVLEGTDGVLHVSSVYLNGLRYENLTFTFKDGFVKEYSCTNYEDEKKNRDYIRENVLYNRDSLPIGEFAIGTNTTAYVMGKKYDIEAKLPILIAEKTGPHFALGDTCYSMSEDVKLYNPDGKEIIAKDNECSIKRLTNPQEAYFNCHTDVTIPYEELAEITVICGDGSNIKIIEDGRYVLEGTLELNDVLDKNDSM